jgi:hypothetical protein
MTFSEELSLLLIGASIALLSSMLTLIIQHFLSLEEDSVKRQRDEVFRKAEDLRKQLLAGVSEASTRGTYEQK